MFLFINVCAYRRFFGLGCRKVDKIILKKRVYLDTLDMLVTFDLLVFFSVALVTEASTGIHLQFVDYNTQE
jgi:hypothetical protein